MPIEIRELLIRVKVEDAEPKKPAGTGRANAGPLTEQDIQKLVDLIADRLQAAQNRQKER